jgi:hypothetical protein
VDGPPVIYVWPCGQWGEANKTTGFPLLLVSWVGVGACGVCAPCDRVCVLILIVTDASSNLWLTGCT